MLVMLRALPELNSTYLSSLVVGCARECLTTILESVLRAPDY
jgi:hypothetical protein